MMWDVCLFHNELTVLRLRAEYLAPLEMRHLTMEATTTFTGQPRTLRTWEPPIPGVERAIVIANDRYATPMQREDAQRDDAWLALKERGARDTDIVLAGDVDEIPTMGALIEAAEYADDPEVVMAIRMPYHSLLANRRLPLRDDVVHRRWPLVGQLGAFRALGGFAAARRACHDFPFVTGGWHLSSMGGPAVVLDKLGSFAHATDAALLSVDADRLRDLAHRGRDVADRWNLELVPDRELPPPIREHPDRYRELMEVCW